MEYQKIIKLLDSVSNQPSKFRAKKIGWSKSWIEKKVQSN